ncbi:heme-binding protein [Curtobacterium sp. MCBD17_008]|nr:heme-binding protein [Curtobacterium sp. MCBD17_008]
MPSTERKEPDMTDITITQAHAAITAAEEKAQELGVPSTITVLDRGARLVAVARQDGAPLVSVDASAAKARTAVSFGAASGDLSGAVQPGAPLYSLWAASQEPLTFVAGGVPVRDADGHVIGGIGSSGGSPDQDLEIANAAVAAL